MKNTTVRLRPDVKFNDKPRNIQATSLFDRRVIAGLTVAAEGWPKCFMTYAEKLRDPRWSAFRDRFIKSRTAEHGGIPLCDDCGESTRSPLHVHHKRYINGAEPWEYLFIDLRLICEECHDAIHATESMARAFVISLEPHQCIEMESLLFALRDAQSSGCVKVAMARAKNAVRAVSEKDQRPGVRSMADLEEEYKEGL